MPLVSVTCRVVWFNMAGKKLWAILSMLAGRVDSGYPVSVSVVLQGSLKK